MFSKDNDNEVLTYSESTNMGASVNNKEYEVIKEWFQSFLSRYQIGFGASMKDTNFVFDSVHLLHKNVIE